ncbi:COG1835 Predicted acyltransferases [Candidatus Nanopelagicaceae bacterium]
MGRARPFSAVGTNRRPSIDLLRFVAAMMVAAMHWGLELGPQRYAGVYELVIIGDLVRNGAFGVDIFFVISGFVIIGTAQNHHAIDFIFARFTRLFPGLLVSMLIVLAVGTHFIQAYEDPTASFIHSIFLTYQVSGVEPIATPLWTLIIEVKFYIGVAIVLFIFPSIFKTSKGIALLLLIWECTILVSRESNSPLGNFLLPYLTLNGFYNLFALGICFNILSRVKVGLTKDFFIISLISLKFIYEIFLVATYPVNLKICLVIISTIILCSSKINFPPRLQQISYLLGLSSYLIYLLHSHLGMVFVLQIQSRISDNIFFITGLSMFLITISSIILAVLIEKPIQKSFQKQFKRQYPNTKIK